MSKHTANELPSIEMSALAEVTGGAHRAGHSDPQLTAMLTSIGDSIKALGNQNNNSSSSLSQMLPLMMLAKKGGGCPGGNCGR